jgi:putative redox protein
MEEGMTAIAEVTTACATGYAQAIRAGSHRLTADEPRSNGGTDAGPAPYALLLSALGACTSITLRMYADRKSWALGAIEVRLRLLKSKDGRERIEREIRFGATLSDEQRARLGEIAGKTPVTRTVSAGAPITTTMVEQPVEQSSG